MGVSIVLELCETDLASHDSLFDVHVAVVDLKLVLDLVLVNLADNGGGGISPFISIELSNFEVVMWNLDHNLIDCNGSWVMGSDNHVVIGLVSIRTDWAISVGTVLTIAPLPLIVVKDESLRLSKLINNLSVDLIDFLSGLVNTSVVIIGNVLLGSAGDGIVMLNNTDNIHHGVLGIDHHVDLLIRSSLINTGQSEKLVGVVQSVRSISEVFFVIGTGGKVPSPE